MCTQDGPEWKHVSPRRRRPAVVVVTRRGCPCTADAVATLRSEGLEPKLCDFGDYPATRPTAPEVTPVIEIDGKLRFVGRIDRVLLRRLLRARGLGANPGGRRES